MKGTGIRTGRAFLAATALLLLPAPPAARAQSAGTVYRQGPGPDHVVAMEAEHAATFATGLDGRRWTFGSLVVTGYSGYGYLQVLPPGGEVLDAGYAAVNARVDLIVDFIATGTHYLWIRGRTLPPPDHATSGTCHAGLDGAEDPSAARIAGFSPSFDWSSLTMDAARASLTVPTTGVHTVSVFMREGGFCLDRIVLTTDADLVPAGMDPAESAQGLPTGAVLTPATGPHAGRNPNGDDVINDRCAASSGGVAPLFGLALLALAFWRRLPLDPRHQALRPTPDA